MSLSNYSRRCPHCDRDFTEVVDRQTSEGFQIWYCRMCREEFV